MTLLFTLPEFFKDPYYIIYHSLILLALLLSYLPYKKGAKKALFLVLVLLATFIVESITAVLRTNHIKGFSWIYHVFNLFEYTLFCLYYVKNCTVKKYKSVVIWSIPVFIIFSFCISCFLYGFTSLPALNINIEGLLLFIIYTQLLFNLDVHLKMSIYNHPDFWISTGVLIYFGGVFVYFSLYRTLVYLDRKENLKLFGTITQPLNIILYCCIIIGLICLLRNKKYLTQ
jgi:hypothetical protein